MGAELIVLYQMDCPLPILETQTCKGERTLSVKTAEDVEQNSRQYLGGKSAKIKFGVAIIGPLY